MSGLAAGDFTFVRPSGNRIAFEDERVRGEADADPEDRDDDGDDGERVPQDRRAGRADPRSPRASSTSKGHAVNLRVPARPMARPDQHRLSASRQSESEQTAERDHGEVVAPGHHR